MKENITLSSTLKSVAQQAGVVHNFSRVIYQKKGLEGFEVERTFWSVVQNLVILDNLVPELITFSTFSPIKNKKKTKH